MAHDEAQSSGVKAGVTVVIPTLNRPALCAAAIRSVVEQHGVVCRILVSENCSEPQHAEPYAQLFQSLPAQVRVLRRSQRMSVEAHFPLLLDQVDTEYVVLLADDDVLHPSFVARALAHAQTTQAGAVFGPYCSQQQAGAAIQNRDFDYTAKSAFLRALRFLCNRNDAFIYGLFRTEVLRAGMVNFQPLQILGRRTLIRIAYAPLLACLLAAPYGHLPGKAVWINTADSAKSEAYLARNRARKLVELVLGEWILAARFIRIVRRARGVGMALALAPVVATMAAWHCVAFILLALRRGSAAILARLRHLARLQRPSAK